MADRIEKIVVLNAGLDRVWNAISDSSQFGAWFGVRLDGPFVEGQEARGAILYPGYEHLTWRAQVVKIQPKALFAFTWHPYGVDETIDYSTETPTLVEFRLEPMGERTRLTITESGFDKVPASRREEAFRMNDGGWSQQAENVRAYVEG